ncbi:MAG: ACT domain-containing protein [Clostridia bacterium]|nr:ACT domain-containing protein [Clostridia bacterium]MBR4014175.1 ACT domain-containing protein [Clostridia bacterium]
MKAVVTVVGHDAKGIIAKVSSKCAERGGNIVEISQSVLKEYFAMIMVIEVNDITVPFATLVEELAELGRENGLDIRAMHEDIFNSMHRI